MPPQCPVVSASSSPVPRSEDAHEVEQRATTHSSGHLSAMPRSADGFMLFLSPAATRPLGGRRKRARLVHDLFFAEDARRMCDAGPASQQSRPMQPVWRSGRSVSSGALRGSAVFCDGKDFYRFCTEGAFWRPPTTCNIREIAGPDES